MNKEYANGMKGNILTQFLFYRLAACLVILLIAYGCAAKPAIIKAAGSGDISTIKRLQTEGQNINEKDSKGATALMYAIWSKKPDVSKYLIESGSDVKAKDKNGMDALIYAVSYGQLELINILLDKGADIESRDNQGDTPLMHAALRGWNIDAVKMLIKRGADVNTKNNAAQPLLDLLLDEPEPITMDIVAELINAGANLLEPAKGKARLIILGERFEEFSNDTAYVTVGKYSKYLNTANRLKFIDIEPGKHTIAIWVSSGQKQPQLSINVKVGQTYYFKIIQHGEAKELFYYDSSTGISQRRITRAAALEPFTIIVLEEKVAKAKIWVLLPKTNI